MIIIDIFRYAFFIASILGWMVYLNKKLGVQAEILPLAVASLTIMVLYTAGLLGIMLYAALAIFAGGAMLFYYYVYKKEMGVFFKTQIIRSVGFWFFGLIMIYFTIRYQAASLEHYDDFSHWATIVKEMWMFDWLPNFNSDAIMFKTYPPGSALYAYYTVRILGFSEPNMLIGQFYLMLAPVLAMSAMLKDKAKLSVGVLFVLACMLIVHPAPDTMLVDTVLALMGLGVITVIYYYRNDVKKAVVLSAPVMMVVMLIKNSGLLFAVLGMVYLIYLIAKEKKANGKTDAYIKNRNAVLIGIAAVIFAFALWKAHTHYIFPYVVTKHTMSLYYFWRTFLNKSMAEIVQISSTMLATLGDIRVHATMTMAIINGGLAVLALIQRFVFKRRVRGIVTALVLADAVFLLYFISLLGMYILSMPAYEAQMLAGFDRYMNTILIYILGIVIMGVLYDSDAQIAGEKSEKQDAIKKKRFTWAYAIMTSMVLVVFGSALIHFDYSWFYRSFKKEGTIPSLFVPAVEENLGSSYVTTGYAFYISDGYPGDDDYFAFAADYRLFTKGSTRIYESTDEEENFAEALQKYDYLVVLVEDEKIVDFLDDFVVKDSYIGKYETKMFAPEETTEEQ